MKTPCSVIRDLLPLYHDDVCSPESRELIEEHLKECEDCRRILEELGADITPIHRELEKAPARELSVMKKAWDENAKRSFRRGFCRGFASILLAAVILLAFLFVPIPHHYDVTFTDVYTFAGDPADMSIRVTCWDFHSIGGLSWCSGDVTLSDANGEVIFADEYQTTPSMRQLHRIRRRATKPTWNPFPYDDLGSRQVDFFADDSEDSPQIAFIVWSDYMENLLFYGEDGHYLATTKGLEFRDLPMQFPGYTGFIWEDWD